MLPPIFNQGQKKPGLPQQGGPPVRPGQGLPKLPNMPGAAPGGPRPPQARPPGQRPPAPAGIPTGIGQAKPQGTPVTNAMAGQGGKNYVPQVLGLIEKLIASGLLAKQ